MVWMRTQANHNLEFKQCSSGSEFVDYGYRSRMKLENLKLNLEKNTSSDAFDQSLLVVLGKLGKQITKEYLIKIPKKWKVTIPEALVQVIDAYAMPSIVRNVNFDF